MMRGVALAAAAKCAHSIAPPLPTIKQTVWAGRSEDDIRAHAECILRFRKSLAIRTMSVALNVYQQLRNAADDDSRARVIADAFEQIEERYPNLKDMATQGHVRESELRLQKEIKETELRLQKEIKTVEGQLQKEIREVEGRLQKEIREVEGRLQKEIREVEGRLQQEIRAVELQVKEVEGRLQKEIRAVELQIMEVDSRLQQQIKAIELQIKEVDSRLQKEIKEVEIRVLNAIHRQTFWVIGSVGTIIGFIRLLDWFLANLPK